MVAYRKRGFLIPHIEVHNIATDVALASLPVPIVWSLKMDRRTRLYLVGILSLGYAAVGLGIVKSVYQIAFGAEKDKTLYISPLCTT